MTQITINLTSDAEEYQKNNHFKHESNKERKGSRTPTFLFCFVVIVHIDSIIFIHHVKAYWLQFKFILRFNFYSINIQT